MSPSQASVTQPATSMNDGEDGPLFFALLLNNQNNNNGNDPALNNVNNGNDTLVVRKVALELKPQAQPRTVLHLRSSPHHECSGHLSNEQLQFWTDHGYLVVPDALPRRTVADLLGNIKMAAEILVSGDDRVVKHTCLPEQRSFVSPVGRVLATLTENALMPGAEPLQRIQRLGCGLHRVIEPFRSTIMSETHEQISRSLGYSDPRVIQSLVIVKAAEVGQRVVPHQDGSSGFTDPSSCTTFWYALEDATVENGCLAVVPGSHRTEPIRRRCRKDQTGRPEFVELERPIFAKVKDAAGNPIPTKDENGNHMYKKLEVKAGTLILMHGNLLHASEINRSKKSRVAFNFGIVEGTHDWLSDNYLQPYEGQDEFEKLQGKRS